MQALRSELERLRRRVEGDAGPPPRPSAPSPDPSLPTAAPSAAPLPRPDFVTSVGPKLLVATGALAFVVFVGLFVKYAWENDWIGPAGRVLSGAVFGLALVALGVRLRGRPYRPLGQGLAGAGLASLYVSAYGAHGFYDLISREAAGALMLAITASAVLLAARLPARLLATLAWTGAYLTPVLLSTGEDRAVSLFLFLLVLDAGALALDRWRPWPETVPLAMLGTTSLYIAWFATFFRAERFDVAAIGLVLFTGVFVAGPRPRARRPGWPARALVIGGIGLSFLAAGADRPAALSATLLGYSAFAILMRRWWWGAEVVGLGASALAVLVWMEAFWRVERTGDAWLLAMPVAGLYLLSLIERGLVHRRRVGAPDVAVHLMDAALVWTVLYQALSESQPRTLGAIAVALATLYLLLGLATIKERSEDRLQVRTLLGLAAVFVTLAIPVQLGLHGITLAWAAEAVLLLALGLRFASPLARAGAYVVLALAAARLFVRHLPLHEGSSFTPVLNAAFGTWLAVILAFAAAFFMRRRARLETALDRAIGPALATLALGLLLTLLTMETEDVFATRARLAGQLALSVLWTLFAMGMLAGGLALRSRPLFYSAYALFAATAVKVVAVDLATLGAVYRMLSFLALALLLMAGAYLNLRFRERLLPKVAAG
ncbi:MAG TPA: DUF2339 domain-containing protein [Vicinamibacteria bacterium]|nr:DUF2339 domain-containing protein [Vicinamibacteria bacterium]